MLTSAHVTSPQLPLTARITFLHCMALPRSTSYMDKKQTCISHMLQQQTTISSTFISITADPHCT